jgi:hypothetical protein
MFNGKINYKWAIFNSYVKLPEGRSYPAKFGHGRYAGMMAPKFWDDSVVPFMTRISTRFPDPIFVFADYLKSKS